MKQLFSREELRNTNLGIEFMISVLIGLVIGYFLDNYFHTRPWLLIVGLFLGIAAGALGVYKAIEDMAEADQKKKKITS